MKATQYYANWWLSNRLVTIVATKPLYVMKWTTGWWLWKREWIAARNTRGEWFWYPSGTAVDQSTGLGLDSVVLAFEKDAASVASNRAPVAQVRDLLEPPAAAPEASGPYR